MYETCIQTAVALCSTVQTELVYVKVSTCAVGVVLVIQGSTPPTKETKLWLTESADTGYSLVTVS